MGDTEAHFVGFRNDVFLWKGLRFIDDAFSGIRNFIKGIVTPACEERTMPGSDLK